jgi:hypothetical protein
LLEAQPCFERSTGKCRAVTQASQAWVETLKSRNFETVLQNLTRAKRPARVRFPMPVSCESLKPHD